MDILCYSLLESFFENSKSIPFPFIASEVRLFVDALGLGFSGFRILVFRLGLLGSGVSLNPKRWFGPRFFGLCGWITLNPNPKP